MIIGIHPDQTGTESYSKKWSAFFERRGLEVRELDLLAEDAVKQASLCDGVMWRWLHNPHLKQSAKQILYVIENYLGIPVFPDFKTSWHYDEKTAQHYLLKCLGAPTPATWVFWDKAKALEWAKSAPYPIVFKLSTGASSQNVIKVTNARDAASLINRAFRRGIFPSTFNRRECGIKPAIRHTLGMLPRTREALRYIFTSNYPPLPSKRWWKPEFGYVYFQEFVPGNTFDTRITVIGDRAFAFRRMNRPNDFRASGGGLADWDQAAIDRRCLEIAFELSRNGGFQSMAYDFLEKNGDPVVGEISYTFMSRYIHDCPGYWDSKLAWHTGNVWPEEAQAEDFLRRVSFVRNRRSKESASPLTVGASSVAANGFLQ